MDNKKKDVKLLDITFIVISLFFDLKCSVLFVIIVVRYKAR